MEIPDVFLSLNHEKSPCLVHEKHIVNTAGNSFGSFDLQVSGSHFWP